MGYIDFVHQRTPRVERRSACPDNGVAVTYTYSVSQNAAPSRPSAAPVAARTVCLVDTMNYSVSYTDLGGPTPA